MDFPECNANVEEVERSITTGTPMHGPGEAGQPEEAGPRTHFPEAEVRVLDEGGEVRELAEAPQHSDRRTHNGEGPSASRSEGQRGVDMEVRANPAAPSLNAIGSGRGSVLRQGQERSNRPRGRVASSSGYESEQPTLGGAQYSTRDQTHQEKDGEARLSQGEGVVYV